jgi:outer membrane protein assembly factor BamE (lipoprotein component of BamABCDE complex)
MVIARVMALALLASLSSCGSSSVSFDREKWASGRGNFEGENPRSSMISETQEAGVKVGATRASIRALLGEPDSTGPGGDNWTLGRAGYAPDYEMLEIDYDKNGIAIKVVITST